VYYTPPALTERLLDLVEEAGVDWGHGRVLDPACGGGAFLVPVAQRMLAHPKVAALTPRERLVHLERHLFGMEIDPFAAWMTRQFLRVLAHDLSEGIRRPPDIPILDTDALKQVERAERHFDLVIGNPPYGRMALTPEQRLEFSRSLFGHANAYGLFLDAALRWRKASGLVAFVTPTSLLSGQYFSKLRSLLRHEAPPLAIDIVNKRTGVFEAVQQETCLAVFGGRKQKKTRVHLLVSSKDTLEAQRAGAFSLADAPRAPWVLPRTQEQARVARFLDGMKTRLHDLGYRASTGPMVWNRHKHQLSQRNGASSYPLIWAEAIRPNQFSFSYRSRAAAPFFRLEPGQDHLLDRGQCVLLQRTTAKEQRRRLIACAVPLAFFEQWDAVVVENHVNVLRRTLTSAVPPELLAAVLNTRTVDLVFRCISGSVAVSATELHALPLPPREVFNSLEELLRDPSELALQEIERRVAKAYGRQGHG
jgi:adenine-specific DNA-methyltransferase